MTVSGNINKLSVNAILDNRQITADLENRVVTTALDNRTIQANLTNRKITANLNSPNLVTSVFGRQGAVKAVNGDYNWNQIGSGYDLNLLKVTKGVLSFNPEGNPTFNSVSTKFIDFDLSPSISGQEGRFMWSADDGTLSLGMPGGNVNLQVGQEGLIRVTNKSGSDIPNGKIVYITGVQGNRPTIGLADKTDANTLHILGMVTENINDNLNGFVAIWGYVRGETSQPINTSSFVVGTKLYLSTTGDWTEVHPGETEGTVIIGTVTKQHASEGIIYLTSPESFTLGNDFNGTIRQSVINKNTGTSSAVGFTAVNDAGHRVTFGLGGENNSVFSNKAVLYNEGYGDFWQAVDGNKDFVWFTDPTDSHDNSSLANEVMRLKADGTLTTVKDIKGLSFSIGANTLNTTEFGFLDGQDQSVFTTSDVQHERMGIAEAPASFAALYVGGGSNIVSGYSGIFVDTQVLPSAPSGADFSGVGGFLTIKGSNFTGAKTANNFFAGPDGLSFTTFFVSGAVSVVDISGASIAGHLGVLGTLNATNLYGVYITPFANLNSANLNATKACGLCIVDFAKSGGTVTNHYGIEIEEPTQGTTNKQVFLTGNGSGSGVWFGSTERLYSSATGLLNLASNFWVSGTTKTDTLILPKASDKGIKVDTTTPTFGFRDLLGEVFQRNTGATKPTRAAWKGGTFGYQFGNGDNEEFEFHIPHDYVKGSEIALHIHWGHNGTLVTGGTCTFDYEMTYAKGHGQESFGTNAISTIVSATAFTGQYSHDLSEAPVSISGGSGTKIDQDSLEPDGIIKATIGLNVNNLTVSGGGVPDPFIHYVDIHYQSTNIATKSKSPDFYN